MARKKPRPDEGVRARKYARLHHALDALESAHLWDAWAERARRTLAALPIERARRDALLAGLRKARDPAARRAAMSAALAAIDEADAARSRRSGSSEDSRAPAHGKTR
jgi:hypothetical protein